MSELIAEARVLVTPDTAAFRSLLIAQTTAAAKGVVVPVTVAPVVSGAAGVAGASAAQAELAAAASASTGAINAETQALARQTPALTADAAAATANADALAGMAAAQQRAAASSATLNRSLGGLGKGAGSAAASFLGVRGATLAATGPFLAGAAGAIALGKSLEIATSFTSEIAVLGAVTEATGTQLARAAQAARDFGSDLSLPGVTAVDAAQTITEFSKAGLDLEDSIAATRGGLQLAQAAQLSFTDAVELSAGALNAFNLEGNQAVHVADVLANAANLAQGGITETALALRQAAAAAEVVGVSFEDTSALLTLLARNGLTGSDAGTALRTSFLRLVNPSKEAAAVLRSLNVQLRDAQGNVRPEIFAEFAQAQSNLAVATQQANAAIVFGQDAFRAFGILGQEGAAGLAEVQEGLEKTGTAAELARTRMTGLAGATENLSNQLSTLGLTAGQTVTPFVTGLVRGLGFAVQGVNELTDVIRGLGGEDFDINTAGLEDLRDRLEEVNEEADHFRESGGFVPVRLGNEADQIVAQIEKIGKALLASPAGLGGFVDLFTDVSPEIASALRDDVITPAEEAEIALTSLGRAFLNIAPGRLFAGGISVVKRDMEGIKTTFEDFGEDVANAFFTSIEITARRAGKQVGATLKEVTTDIASTLARDLAIAQAGGDEGGELAILRQREQRQESFLEAVLGREQTEKNVELATKAAQNLDRTRAEITAIVEGNAADAQRARDEQQRIAEEDQRDADRVFLERQGDVRARQQRLVGLTDETEGLQDDIKRRQQLRTIITQQISALRQASLDEKTKQAAIKALVAAKQATSDEINKLTRTQAEQNREQREAAQEERESAQIALGESILDLTGNKNPLLRALNEAVRDAIRERNVAKKGSVAFIEAQTEINNLLKRRKDILEDVEKDQGGKSLAAFLTENTDLFNQLASSGGLVGVDPFSGFDFSASIVSATKRMQDAVKAQQLPTTVQQAQKPTTDAIDRLIAALERNTAAKEGNTATGGDVFNGGTTYAAVTAKRAQALGDFWQARQARTLEQARFDGGGGV